MIMLDKERAYLNAHKDELLKQYGGKYLVIRGEQVGGAYDTIEDALHGTALMYGLEDVLIRRAQDADLEISVPALTLGIMNANLPHSNSGSREDTGR
jgi:hypothetical protein